VIPLEFHLTLKSHSFEFPEGGLGDRKEQKNNCWEVTWKPHVENPPEVGSGREPIKISQAFPRLVKEPNLAEIRLAAG
jgi:hypothetical protein